MQENELFTHDEYANHIIPILNEYFADKNFRIQDIVDKIKEKDLKIFHNIDEISLKKIIYYRIDFNCHNYDYIYSRIQKVGRIKRREIYYHWFPNKRNNNSKLECANLIIRKDEIIIETLNKFFQNCTFTLKQLVRKLKENYSEFFKISSDLQIKNSIYSKFELDHSYKNIIFRCGHFKKTVIYKYVPKQKIEMQTSSTDDLLDVLTRIPSTESDLETNEIKCVTPAIFEDSAKESEVKTESELKSKILIGESIVSHINDLQDQIDTIKEKKKALETRIEKLLENIQASEFKLQQNQITINELNQKLIPEKQNIFLEEKIKELENHLIESKNEIQKLKETEKQKNEILAEAAKRLEEQENQKEKILNLQKQNQELTNKIDILIRKENNNIDERNHLRNENLNLKNENEKLRQILNEKYPKAIHIEDIKHLKKIGIPLHVEKLLYKR